MKTGTICIMAALAFGCGSSQASPEAPAAFGEVPSAASQSEAAPEPAAAEPAAAEPAAAEPAARGGAAPGPAAGQGPMHGDMHGEMAGDMHGEMAGMCPMAVEGTSARAEEVQGGAALVFTTSGDLAELRRRVAAMADMHSRRSGEGGGPGMKGGHPHGAGGAAHGAGGGMRGGGAMLPPANARVDLVQGGARLVFTPQDPAALAELRERVQQRAQMMASGQCPMMAMRGQGAAATPPGEPSAISNSP